MRIFNRKRLSLQVAIFATGFSGIVAEYILATIAVYFLGNSIFQWTITISLMLFSMGLGSRYSKHIRGHLPFSFILIEYALSLLVAFSPLSIYALLPYLQQSQVTGFMIYLLCCIIGFLIGMEIPLVVRINRETSSLRKNISSVLEQDYYGSLLGGVFFAFVGLPFLGIAHTPLLIGCINFGVALLVFLLLRDTFKSQIQKLLTFLSFLLSILLISGFLFAEPLILYGEQSRYQDKMIYLEQTPYQKIVITQLGDHYWLYSNGNIQLSSLDEPLYHEPLVHPAMYLAKYPQHVLVLGGGDGCAVREVLKYPSVQTIGLVDIDKRMTTLASTHPILTVINDSSLSNPKVTIINDDAFTWIEKDTMYYDVIIADFPDPRSVELSRLYSREFYAMVYRRLKKQGVFVTQSGSPYYTPKVFQCIKTTLKAARFHAMPMHNQILTFGEWGWLVATKELPVDKMKEYVRASTFKHIDTKWLTQESMNYMTSFGKPFYNQDTVEVNTLSSPVLSRYYTEGSWEVLY